MTSYLEGKNSPAVSADLPGPLCFSERISLHPLSGTRWDTWNYTLTHNQSPGLNIRYKIL